MSFEEGDCENLYQLCNPGPGGNNEKPFRGDEVVVVAVEQVHDGSRKLGTMEQVLTNSNALVRTVNV